MSNSSTSPDGRKAGPGACASTPKGARPTFEYRAGWQDRVPELLRERDQWVLWRYGWRKGKYTKIPYQAHKPREEASSIDPQTWNPFEAAVRAYLRLKGTKDAADGVGFVFAHGGGLVGFDLDGVILPDGAIDPWGLEHLALLTPTYHEISPSGGGIKGVALGELPGSGVNKRGLGPGGKYGLELYDAGRFFTITGDPVDDCTTIEDRSGAILDLYGRYKSAPHESNGDIPHGPPLAGDDELLDRARKARNGRKFATLFDEGAYTKGSQSEADLALCCLLAFWFNRDATAIGRVFRRSKLMRDKWDDPRGDTTYGAMTITKAIAYTDRVYTPPKPPGPGDGDQAEPVVFANYREFTPEKSGDGEPDPVKVALRMTELQSALDKIIPGWPKCVDGELFLEGSDGKPRVLESSTQTFAWINTVAQVAWTKGTKFIPQEQFYEHLRVSVERYDSVETLPHFPPRPRTYYMHPDVGRSSGRILDRLMDFYRPATGDDRELLLAFILTGFWGGPPGARPAFLFTGPGTDPEQGRGVGKTSTPDTIAQGLAGGYLNVSANADMEKITTRLLSPEGMRIRFARLDNVKTLRLSWSELESIITDHSISGHRMFRGEGQRPNLLTWYITLNGASLSKDMAQRCVEVRLARPAFTPTWSSDVADFIDRNRWGLIAEIKTMLEDEQGYVTAKTRWAAWEAGVLSRTGRLAECQALILARQGEIDAGSAEADLVMETFARKIRTAGYKPDGVRVFIPGRLAAEWLSEGANKRFETGAATTHIKGLCIKNLEQNRTNKVRGWVWTGDEANPFAEPFEIEDIGPQYAVGGRTDERHRAGMR